MQDFITCELLSHHLTAMTNLIFVSISCTLECFVQSVQAFSASYNAVQC